VLLVAGEPGHRADVKVDQTVGGGGADHRDRRQGSGHCKCLRVDRVGVWRPLVLGLFVGPVCSLM
jgi:hypothetical protein